MALEDVERSPRLSWRVCEMLGCARTGASSLPGSGQYHPTHRFRSHVLAVMVWAFRGEPKVTAPPGLSWRIDVLHGNCHGMSPRTRVAGDKSSTLAPRRRIQPLGRQTSNRCNATGGRTGSALAASICNGTSAPPVRVATEARWRGAASVHGAFVANAIAVTRPNQPAHQ